MDRIYNLSLPDSKGEVTSLQHDVCSNISPIKQTFSCVELACPEGVRTSGGRTSHILKMEHVVIFIDCLIYLWEYSPHHPLDGPPEPGWTSGEHRSILSLPGSDPSPACCELKNQPLSKGSFETSSLVACGSAKPLRDCEIALSKW
jgi:hypothetical protein